VNNPLYVHADWDAEAGVWVARSNDVPGLTTEAASFGALVIKMKTLVPELLEANGATMDQCVDFELLVGHFDPNGSTAC
jgi:hypothetical protein